MRRTLAFLALLTAIACTTDSTPTAPLQDSNVRLGRGTTAPIPRARIVFDDIVNVAASGAAEDWRPAGITGDGRLRNGDAAVGTPSNEYQGGLCGVQANIENGPRQGGDLDYDPDNGYTTATACGPARFYNFHLSGPGGSPVHSGAHSRVFGIWALAVGQSANKGQGFGVGLANCAILMFNSQYGGDDLRVTRIDDGTGPRRWIVASQGAHMAACVVQLKKGAVNYTPTGVKHFLPFSLSVTEVP